MQTLFADGSPTVRARGLRLSARADPPAGNDDSRRRRARPAGDRVRCAPEEAALIPAAEHGPPTGLGELTAVWWTRPA